MHFGRTFRFPLEHSLLHERAVNTSEAPHIISIIAGSHGVHSAHEGRQHSSCSRGRLDMLPRSRRTINSGLMKPHRNNASQRHISPWRNRAPHCALAVLNVRIKFTKESRRTSLLHTYGYPRLLSGPLQLETDGLCQKCVGTLIPSANSSTGTLVAFAWLHSKHIHILRGPRICSAPAVSKNASSRVNHQTRPIETASSYGDNSPHSLQGRTTRAAEQAAKWIHRAVAPSYPVGSQYR